jgi:type I restriction enzyme R subunit
MVPEIHDIYECSSLSICSNILSFATEGNQLFYGAIRCPLEFWAPWRIENDETHWLKKIRLV